MSALDTLIEKTRQADPVLAGQAALEIAEARSLVAELMTEYWRLEEGGNYVVCRHCGQSAWRGMDIEHRPTCPVKRGTTFLANATS